MKKNKCPASKRIRCTKCLKYKLPKEYYHRSRPYNNQLERQCKDCKKAHGKKTFRLSRFGLTEQQYKVKLNQRKGVCAICGKEPGTVALCVDHNHDTNQIRGLLCHACNSALGKFQDSIYLLQNAINYLYTYYQG